MADDFPAAHSMDTMWFAVDADGRVARFTTGEAGAVPSVAGNHQNVDVKVLPLQAEQAIFDIAGLREYHGASHVSGRDGDGFILMLVRSIEEGEELCGELGGREALSTEGPAITLIQPDVPDLVALHERGACRGCFPVANLERDIAWRGVYDYWHTTDNWIAGPYALVQRPPSPIHGDDLPDAIAAHAVRFAGRFDDTPRLQPAELWDCEAWDPMWLATDGKTIRPFDGREQEVAEYIDNNDPDSKLDVQPALERPRGEVVRPARDD